MKIALPHPKKTNYDLWYAMGTQLVCNCVEFVKRVRASWEPLLTYSPKTGLLPKTGNRAVVSLNRAILRVSKGYQS